LGGVNSQSREMAEFDSFLVDLELVNMPLVVHSFSWFHPNGVAMSRLDRVLLLTGCVVLLRLAAS
jgi:hypothetical protein